MLDPGFNGRLFFMVDLGFRKGEILGFEINILPYINYGSLLIMDKHFPYTMTHRLRISHELANRNVDIFSAHGWKMSEGHGGNGKVTEDVCGNYYTEL